INRIRGFVDSFSQYRVNVKEEEVAASKPIADKDDKAEKAEKERQKKITQALKEELDFRAEAFEKYEAYKTRVSEQEAENRYGNDLMGFKKYDDYLQSQMNDLLKGRDPLKLSGEEYNRYELVLNAAQEYLRKKQDAENEAFAVSFEKDQADKKKLLESYLTYEEKRQKI